MLDPSDRFWPSPPRPPPRRGSRGAQEVLRQRSAADCCALAGIHARGEGGAPRDPEKAAAFLKKACELTSPPACLDLAAAYAHRRGRQEATR